MIKPHDTGALERAMARYLDPETITAHGRAARRRAVEAFSLDVCLERYLNLA